MISNKSIALIGTRWGRIYPWIFREHGYSIDLLLGRDAARTQAIALEEGIPEWSTDSVNLDKYDAVIIASPVQTHRKFLQQCRDKFILCEKPALGPGYRPGDETLFANEEIYTNYAFGQLETARAVEAWLKQQAEGPEKIILDVRASFPGDKTLQEWMLDVMIHELYWLNQLHSPFHLTDFQIKKDIQGHMKGARGLNLQFRYGILAQEGIHVNIQWYFKENTLTLQGGYLPFGGWYWDEVVFQGETVHPAKDSSRGDIWAQANKENAGLFIRRVSGELSRDQVIQRGLAGWEQATQIEKNLSAFFSD